MKAIDIGCLYVWYWYNEFLPHCQINNGTHKMSSKRSIKHVTNLILVCELLFVSEEGGQGFFSSSMHIKKIEFIINLWRYSINNFFL